MVVEAGFACTFLWSRISREQHASDDFSEPNQTLQFQAHSIDVRRHVVGGRQPVYIACTIPGGKETFRGSTWCQGFSVPIVC